MQRTRECTFQVVGKWKSNVLKGMFDGGLSTETVRQYREQRALSPITELSFKYGNYGDLRELKADMEDVTAVHMDIVEEVDWKTLQSLPKLKYLGTGEDPGYTNIGDREFANVDYMICYWHQTLVNKLYLFPKLKSLQIRKVKSKDLSFLNQTQKLVNLDISGSRTLQQIGEIGELKKLKLLWLDRNSQLINLEPIGQCNKLKSLCVTDNKKASGYQALSKLVQLEELIINAELPSLEWLTELKQLRILRFDCKLEDGDLGFLLEMDSLQHVFFPNRRNYSLKRAEIEGWLKERGYDPDSEEPDYGAFHSIPGRLY